MHRLSLIATIATLCANATILRVSAQERKPVEEAKVEKTLSSRNASSAKLDVWVGNIKVFADSQGDVKVTAVRRAEGGTPDERHRWLTEATVQIEQQGNVILVKDIVPESLRQSMNHRNGRSSLQVHLNLDVHVPPQLALDVHDSAGNIRIEGAGSGLNIDSSAGNITLSGLRCANKQVNIHHGAGNVEMNGQVGDVTVENGAGNIVGSRLDCTGRVADLHAGVGGIELSLAGVPSEHLKADVGTGQVSLGLLARTRASVSASTGMGKIGSDLQLTSLHRSGSAMGGSLKGDLNGGGPLLTLHTGIGEVHLAAK